MSREHTETVRQVFEAWAAGEFGWGPAEVDEHLTFVVSPSFPAAGVFVGPDQISEYWRDFLEQWERTSFEATRLRSAGDTIVVDVTQYGRGKQSGLAVDLQFFMLFTFRGRKLVRVESTMDERDALASAGLSE
jgi:ketosteroid isomerase-like protein